MRVLITVKTYPTLSAKYDELVCTAGFTEDGRWIRIYPVEYRKKPYKDQYSKYDWVEVDLVENTSDFRPESFRPRTADTEFVNIGKLDTKGNWAKRKEIVLKKGVHDNLTKLVAEAQDKAIGTSLAVFKPTKIIDFIIEQVEREWDPKKLESLKQFNLFESTEKNFEVVRKLPFKFKYKIEDIDGRQSTMMIEDWETGQLFWNCLNRTGDEVKACELVRQKYIDDFAQTKDLHLFLGTTKRFHFTGKNPFVIVGTFTPRIDTQTKLDLF